MTAIRSQIPNSSGRYELTTRIALPCGGQLADQAIDLGLGADVDAAGRLVQEQDVGLLVEQPRQGHFLLVAARKARRRSGPGPVALIRSRAIQRATSARRSLSRSQPRRACRLSAE